MTSPAAPPSATTGRPAATHACMPPPRLTASKPRCSKCHNVYCDNCILLSQATRGRPLCTECALIVAGVHHKRTRPLVS